MTAHVPDRAKDSRRQASFGAQHPLSVQTTGPVAPKDRNHSAPRHRAETEHTHTGFEAGAL